ncbi:MAG: 7-cyano-7-deazaguanine synthase QueC [Candidatus Kariarchaeaceae archaeon]|jgi:7-cyano-7-deazaguanine synthase
MIKQIISGGLDSTAMLWYLASEGYDILEAITFNYGQRHRIETQYATKIIDQFQETFTLVAHQIVDISSIGNLIAKGSLTGSNEVPHDMYDSENQRVTVVPNRNMIFISIATGRAVTLGANYVGYAAHASDYSVYPDCRPDFIEQLDKAIYLGNLWDPVNLIAPFQNKSKTDIVTLGLQLNVPFELTWSCYEGLARPCLKCGTCLERTEAFQNNNTRDPALSEEEWKEAQEFYKRTSGSKIA